MACFETVKHTLWQRAQNKNLPEIGRLTFLCTMAEEEGFEPPRAVTPLAVFETAPFSQTWVFLRTKMEPIGFEPMTSCVRGRRSPS